MILSTLCQFLRSFFMFWMLLITWLTNLTFYMIYMIMEFERKKKYKLEWTGVNVDIFNFNVTFAILFYINNMCFFLLTHSNFIYVYLLLFLTTWKLARGLPNIATTNVYKVGLIYLCMAYVKETARYYRFST